jgi:hypothetical protein
LEAHGLESSELEDGLGAEDDFEFLNHFDSLKADFQQEDVEDWSEEEDGDMDELMELCREDLTGIMVNMMLEDNPNDLDRIW